LVPLCQKKKNVKTDLFVDDREAHLYSDAKGKRIKGFRITKCYGAAFDGQTAVPSLDGGLEFSDKFLHFLSFIRQIEPVKDDLGYCTVKFPLEDFVSSCTGDVFKLDREAMALQDSAILFWIVFYASVLY